MRNIFEMFYQASPTSGGSGLGLYIAMESVKKLHGTLTVDSEYGKWASFKITLPNLKKEMKTPEIANV